MKLLCAWCGVLMRDGTEPVSHGCCPKCIHLMLGDPALSIPEAERRLEEAQRSR